MQLFFTAAGHRKAHLHSASSSRPGSQEGVLVAVHVPRDDERVTLDLGQAAIDGGRDAGAVQLVDRRDVLRGVGTAKLIIRGLEVVSKR